MSFNPMSPPSPSVYGTPSPESENMEANRAAKVNNKRYWTHEEEERLASAWLNTSKDPIHGNDKKGDTFWKEVTDMFNKKGEGKRIREANQLKIHWCRLKASIGDFNDYWIKANQMHTSGYSDDMLEKEAQEMYVNRFGKPFTLVHWWKILKEEPKWCALFDTEKDKAEVHDIPEKQMRPIGRDSAKAERNGNHKKAKLMDGIVNLGDTVEKIVKVQEDRKMELEKIAEAQIQISKDESKVEGNLKASYLIKCQSGPVPQIVTFVVIVCHGAILVM
ncbi:glutathione S-transferase T3 [Sorghum bicolor]|uniref:glutathione S-transferase T3 n=1 Tax=Sorghum bicolor TaxID=4558 RepID=UPI000B4255C7|nr:glutathione S-transferase T3 [Sorghum bicolor]|eukprot:XP_021303245.1 glutathione S-transferase T3 [Sorghum bicolor]